MRFTRSLWLAAISLALSHPSPPAGGKYPRYGGTLRVELSLTSVSLDPRTWKAGSVTGATNEKLAALIYDRLITLDEYGRFQPGLATEWSHDAWGKAWQFRLRDGVQFSDGSPLTPKDVVAALQPLLPPGLQILATENGVVIRAARAVPDLLEQLASGRYFVYRELSGGNLLGTGSFVVAETSPAAPSEANPLAMRPAHLKLRANEDTWAGRPLLDAIDMTLGNPPLRQILNLQIGRAEIVDIPPDLVRKARQENLRVWSSPPETLLALRFDDGQSLATDARLREALDLALDRDTMANVLLQRQALPAAALLPQWLTGYAFLFGFTMNLDRARELRVSLATGTAGAGEPLRLRVDAAGDLMKLLGERVVVNARQANLPVQLVSHTAPGAGGGAEAAASVGLHLFAWHYDSLSPRIELQELARLLHQDSGAKAGADSLDPEKLYGEERRLLASRQILPLVLLPEYIGIAGNVRHWSAAPSGEWRLADVWLATAEPTEDAGKPSKSGAGAAGVHP